MSLARSCLPYAHKSSRWPHEKFNEKASNIDSIVVRQAPVQGYTYVPRKNDLFAEHQEA
jgi:hypothetical protein